MFHAQIPIFPGKSWVNPSNPGPPFVAPRWLPCGSLVPAVDPMYSAESLSNSMRLASRYGLSHDKYGLTMVYGRYIYYIYRVIYLYGYLSMYLFICLFCLFCLFLVFHKPYIGAAVRVNECSYGSYGIQSSVSWDISPTHSWVYSSLFFELHPQVWIKWQSHNGNPRGIFQNIYGLMTKNMISLGKNLISWGM